MGRLRKFGADPATRDHRRAPNFRDRPLDLPTRIVDNRDCSKKSTIMEAWVAVGVVAEGQQISVLGLNPWSFDWTRSTEPPVEWTATIILAGVAATVLAGGEA